MPDLSHWTPSNVWAGPDGRLPVFDKRPADDLDLHFESDVSLATIIARDGAVPRIATLVQDCFGCRLPASGHAAFGATADLVSSGPGQWLAVGKSAPWPRDLAETFEGVAAVTDQSDSRALVRLSGRTSRIVLAKGFSIDLHPRAFSTGTAAMTKVAHIGVHIWQVDDRPSFTIAVPRSYAAGFWSWLRTAAQSGAGS